MLWEELQALNQEAGRSWESLGLDGKLAYRIRRDFNGAEGELEKPVTVVAGTLARVCLYLNREIGTLGLAPEHEAAVELEIPAEREKLLSEDSSWRPPAEVAHSNVAAPMSGAALLFGRTPRLGWWLTHPFAIALAWIAFGLLIAAWAAALGVASVPLPGGANDGFFHSTWCWAFLIIAPLAFAIVARINAQVPQQIARLESCCIEAVGAGSDSYAAHLAWTLHVKSRGRLAVITLVSTVIILIDMHRDLRGYLGSLLGYDWAYNSLSWANAAIRPGGPSLAANFLFFLVAFLGEGLVLFLALFWIASFRRLLREITRLFEPGGEFRFSVDQADAQGRLGLAPLGTLFNGYIGVTLVFLAYTAWHRLEEAAVVRGEPIGEYLRALSEVFRDPSLLFHRELYAFESFDFGMVFLFVAAGILVWPAVDYLRRIHSHSIELRQKLHHRNARSAEDQQLLDVLNKADLWPNGALLGNVLLTIGIALLLIAAFPPWLPLLTTALACYFFLFWLAINFRRALR